MPLLRGTAFSSFLSSLGGLLFVFVQLFYSSWSFLCPPWAGRSCFSQCAMCHCASCGLLGRRSFLFRPLSGLRSQLSLQFWETAICFCGFFYGQRLRSASSLLCPPPGPRCGFSLNHPGSSSYLGLCTCCAGLCAVEFSRLLHGSTRSSGDQALFAWEPFRLSFLVFLWQALSCFLVFVSVSLCSS